MLLLTIDGPAIIILSLVCANIRSCAHASSILRAFDILLAISKYLTDETKLDRMLPFVVSLLQNDAACVRAAALRTLTQTVSSCSHMIPSSPHCFTDSCDTYTSSSQSKRLLRQMPRFFLNTYYPTSSRSQMIRMSRYGVSWRKVCLLWQKRDNGT